MNRLTRTIPDNSQNFGSKGTKEVFIPRYPLVNKVTGNLAATHKKMRIASELQTVEQEIVFAIANFEFKRNRKNEQESKRRKVV